MSLPAESVPAYVRRLAYREQRPWFADMIDDAVERISRIGRPLGPGRTTGTRAIVRVAG